MITAELNSLGVSNVKFGVEKIRFIVPVAENTSSGSVTKVSTNSGDSNTVGIVGLESPFYSPNNHSAKNKKAAGLNR